MSAPGKLTSPSIIKALLDSLDHRPNKGLGQNYLIDSNILGIIVAAAEPVWETVTPSPPTAVPSPWTAAPCAVSPAAVTLAAKRF